MKENNWDNPKLRGSCCVLNAYGVGFKPELFLSETTFDLELIVLRGKLDFPKGFKNEAIKVAPSESKFFETVFLSLFLSKSEESATQVNEAALFFERYRDEVLRLSKFPNIEHLSLVFKVVKDEQENLPDEIKNLAFSCGVTIIQW